MSKWLHDAVAFAGGLAFIAGGLLALAAIVAGYRLAYDWIF